MYRESQLTHSRRETGPQPVFTLHSRNSVWQGDVLGPALFALGYAVALRAVRAAHPVVDVPSYLDDTHMIATLVKATHAAELLRDERVKIGLDTDVGKTVAICAARDITTMALPACVTASKKGSKVLGVPVGTEPFVVAYASAKLATAIKQLRLLPLLENHQSAMLVPRLSFSPRPRFLASVLPVAAMQPVFTEWDTEMRSCLCVPLQGTNTPRVFGTGAGFGGVIVMADEHPFIRFRGWLRNSAAVGTLFPTLPSPAWRPSPTAPPTRLIPMLLTRGRRYLMRRGRKFWKR